AWGHGLWHGTLAPLALGATIASYRGKYDPTTLLTALAQLEVNNLSAAATHYRMLRHAAIPDGWRHSIEKLSFTGEPIDSETAAWAQRTFGTTVAGMYGTTEVGVILVSYPGASDFEIKPDSLGKAVPGLEVDVHDASGNTCVPGQRGEIVVRRKDSWFATKDIGYLDTDGYFYHGGRADDAIISAGWTMSAVEIEDVLLKHPDVREVAVIGSPDRERGLVPKAFVVSPREGSPIFAEELKQLAKTRLSQHEYPRKIEFVTALPKLPAGKINRKALREIEQE
ncbi:MAG: AMP-binding protein, partial [Pseudomonadota bacterium]